METKKLNNFIKPEYDKDLCNKCNMSLGFDSKNKHHCLMKSFCIKKNIVKGRN